MGDADGKFSGYGSSDNVISVMTEKPVTLPAGIQSTTYKMAYTDYYTKTDMQKNVSVAIDGNDIYLGKFYNNYWIKGTINGSKVTFPTEQYLGSEKISYANHEYFLVFDSQTYQSVNSMEFDYDKAAGTLTSSQILAVNQGKKYAALIEVWMNPTLTDAHFVVAAPATPVIVSVMPYGAEEGSNVGAMAYQLNTKTDDGQELNSDNIYYNVYLDGKLTTFSYPTYQALSASLTDIPFGFYDYYTQQSSGAIGYDFAVYNGMQYIYFYNSFNTVGLKAMYIDNATGAKYESHTVTYDVTTGNTTTGISATAADNGTVKSVVYHDLSGRKVSEPLKGIYMKTVESAKGKTSSVKIIK